MFNESVFFSTPRFAFWLRRLCWRVRRGDLVVFIKVGVLVSSAKCEDTINVQFMFLLQLHLVSNLSLKIKLHEQYEHNM